MNEMINLVQMIQNDSEILSIILVKVVEILTLLELPVYIDYDFYRSHAHILTPIKVKHIEV